MIDNNLKRNLRMEYLNLRNSIIEKKNKSKIICNKIINNSFYKDSKIIAVYKSLNSEVDTSILIENAFKNKKIVLLPRVVGNELEFYKLTSKDETLEKSNFGVYEPKVNKDNYFECNNIDLVIVPGVCFDTDKNRLGFGKGYYDSFLKRTHAKSIAIAFEEQILKNRFIPFNSNDIKVDKIITDENEY